MKAKHLYSEALSQLIDYWDIEDKQTQNIFIPPQRDGVCSWTCLVAFPSVVFRRANPV